MDKPWEKVFGSSATLPAEKTLIEAEEEPQVVYMIKTGYVIAYDLNFDGSRAILYILGPGDMFPLSWALHGNIPEFYFSTLTETKLLTASPENFLNALNNDLAFSNYVRDRVFILLETYTNRVRNLEFPRVRQRIAYRLVFLAKYYGETEGSSIKIKVPYRHQHMADSISSTRDTVNREMLKLKDQGIVNYANETVWIESPEQLVKVLEELS